MTNAELTALHTETVNAAQTARTLANISRRATSLFTEGGYKVYNCAGTHRYEVTSPKGDKYQVWHGARVGYDCNCPAFGTYTTCKHLQAIDLMKQDEADAARLDSVADEADYDRFAYRY